MLNLSLSIITLWLLSPEMLQGLQIRRKTSNFISFASTTLEEEMGKPESLFFLCQYQILSISACFSTSALHWVNKFLPSYVVLYIKEGGKILYVWRHTVLKSFRDGTCDITMLSADLMFIMYQKAFFSFLCAVSCLKIVGKF